MRSPVVLELKTVDTSCASRHKTHIAHQTVSSTDKPFVVERMCPALERWACLKTREDDTSNSWRSPVTSGGRDLFEIAYRLNEFLCVVFPPSLLLFWHMVCPSGLKAQLCQTGEKVDRTTRPQGRTHETVADRPVVSSDLVTAGLFLWVVRSCLLARRALTDRLSTLSHICQLISCFLHGWQWMWKETGE